MNSYITNHKLNISYRKHFWCKLTIISVCILALFLFITPVLAASENESNYIGSYYVRAYMSSILYNYFIYDTPDMFHINFSVYEDITYYNAVALGSLGSSTFNTTFDMSYAGDVISNGTVYVNHTNDTMNFIFDYWNTTFISLHPHDVNLALTFGNPSLFSTIGYSSVNQNRYLWDNIYTISDNSDIYLGALVFNQYNINTGLYHTYGVTYNNKMKFNSTISENFTTYHPPDSYINFTDTPYTEFDNAIVYYDVEKIMNDYPNKRIFLEIAVPKKVEPFYNYAAYELSETTGYRGLEITQKSPTVRTYDNVSAFIRAYDLDMGDFTTLLEIETPVIDHNHTLIEYTDYDYPINESYITGQYISVNIDIMDYIETDFLGYPDEYFKVWVHGYSNSNQGNRYETYAMDAGYWDADHFYVYNLDHQPFSSIDANFNATVETYVTVYRNGNTTRLEPTIWTNMYADGYIPQGEEGYIPPDIPDEPDIPDIPDPEPDPEPEPNPDIPVVNYTTGYINISWTNGYYGLINRTITNLTEPMYEFTNYSLVPIIILNNSIGVYNVEMNATFAEATTSINTIAEPISIVYNSLPNKILNVITYYLIWVVLLIIFRKE